MADQTIYTVVVADDEDELRQAVCTMIPWEDLGFRLVGDASNGLDALELVEKLEPDLLLTDIRMPFISGIELARQVREIRPAMHIAFLSGYDDFEYAKQAIQYNIISYMLKPLTMDGLAAELRGIHEKIDRQFAAFQQQLNAAAAQTGRDEFLVPLVLDSHAELPPHDTEFRLRTDACRCGLLRGADDRPLYVVITTALYDDQGGNCTPPTFVHVIETLAGKYLRHAVFCTPGKVVAVLMGNASDFEEYLHILAEEILQTAHRVLGRRGSVGVSRRTDRLSGLHAAYREAAEAASLTPSEEGGVQYITDVRRGTPAAVEEVTACLEEVKTAFRAGDRDAVCAGLARMCSQQPGENCGPWLDAVAVQLMAEVYRLLEAGAGPEALEELDRRGLLPDLSLRYRNTHELRQALQDLCLGAMDQLSTQQKKGGSLLCQKALAAIDEHYMDKDLSLVSLSAMLDVSPNHLSACIKKYAGETFINILIGKRMAAARELLMTTPLKIQQIAARCGYTDQHYFSYCFKKYCGTSPNALRRQQGAKS